MKPDVGLWLAVEARQQHDARHRASWLGMTHADYRDQGDAQVYGAEGDRERAEAEFERHHPAALDPVRHDMVNPAPDPAELLVAAERSVAIRAVLATAGVPATAVDAALKGDARALGVVRRRVCRDGAAISALRLLA